MAFDEQVWWWLHNLLYSVLHSIGSRVHLVKAEALITLTSSNHYSPKIFWHFMVSSARSCSSSPTIVHNNWPTYYNLLASPSLTGLDIEVKINKPVLWPNVTSGILSKWLVFRCHFLNASINM